MKGCFGFDSAILILKAGGRVRRLSWEPGTWLRLYPSYHKMDLGHQPEILQCRADGGTHGFIASCRDMICEDWTAADPYDLPKD